MQLLIKFEISKIRIFLLINLSLFSEFDLKNDRYLSVDNNHSKIFNIFIIYIFIKLFNFKYLLFLIIIYN